MKLTTAGIATICCMLLSGVAAALKAGVKRVCVLSTDKAAYPINAMGISKAMMEKVAVAEE